MITLLLKASVTLAVLLVFYKIFLDKESFFAANRIYLIGCLVLVFLLPFVSLPRLVEDQGFISTIIETSEETETPAVDSETAVAEKIQVASETGDHSPGKSENQWMVWLLWLYYFGVVIFALNLVVQIIGVVAKILKSTDKVPDMNAVIVNHRTTEEPCSFFHYIFINPERYDHDTYNQILSHEQIHVRKLHTIDLLLSEIAIILLWFNPLIWVLRKEIEKNIEYQTDDQMLAGKTVERERYQMNLLSIAAHKKPLTITTNYNQSLIRQRILRMGAKKSNQHNYWKYAFIAPILFAVLLSINRPLSAFGRNVGNTQSMTNAGKEYGPPYEYDCKALLRSVKAGDVDRVKELLRTVDPDCTYSGDGEPRSPLVTAARQGNLAIGKLLIQAGADVDFHASMDETPLIAVSSRGYVDFARYLIANGAMVNKEVGGDGTALLVAARDGHLEIVQYLISKGADVNGQVRGDGTPLIGAVRYGHYEIARILLEHGADPYLESPGDEYPMFHARSSHNEAMIELLKKY